MKITLAVILSAVFCLAASVRAADAPKTDAPKTDAPKTDNTKKCADLQTQLDTLNKTPNSFMAKLKAPKIKSQMKTLNCPVAPAPAPKK